MAGPPLTTFVGSDGTLLGQDSLDPDKEVVTADGSVSNLDPSTFYGPSQIHQYDLIEINGIVCPLAGPPDSGTNLEIDKHKAKGADFNKVISRGFDNRHTKFTLMLFIDLTPQRPGHQGLDWIRHYTSFIKDALMPQKFDNTDATGVKYHAVKVFHPCLASDGILELVIIKRSTPKHVGKQFFHVEVEGIDTRYADFNTHGTAQVKKGGKLNTRQILDLNDYTPSRIYPGGVQEVSPGVFQGKSGKALMKNGIYIKKTPEAQAREAATKMGSTSTPQSQSIQGQESGNTFSSVYGSSASGPASGAVGKK